MLLRIIPYYNHNWLHLKKKKNNEYQYVLSVFYNHQTLTKSILRHQNLYFFANILLLLLIR